MSDAAPELDVANWSGPLDFLLEQVRAQRVDIARLPITEIVAQAADALERVISDRPLAVTSNWLVMASWLVWLRSRLLVEGRDRAWATEEAEQLRGQLMRADWVERAAKALAQRPMLGRDVFAPRPESTHQARRADLLEAMLLVAEERQRRRATPDAGFQVIRFSYTIQDAIVGLRAALARTPQGVTIHESLRGRTADETSRQPLVLRHEVAATFLAALELARQGRLSVEQTAAGPIMRRRG